MEIRKQYAYRLEYSKEEFMGSQTITLEDDTPRQAVLAETIVLGLKVRLGILIEVFESELITDEDMYDQLNNSFMTLLRKAQREVKKLDVLKDKKVVSNQYEGYSDYLIDVRYVKATVEAYLKEIKERLDDEDED